MCSWKCRTGRPCRSTPAIAEISVLDLGPLRWVFVPGEATLSAARQIEWASDATQVVSLTNGYVGYIEAPDKVAMKTGESKRQYFGPELLQIVVAAARLGVSALSPAIH